VFNIPQEKEKKSKGKGGGRKEKKREGIKEKDFTHCHSTTLACLLFTVCSAITITDIN